jgi:hypothetical protein
MDWWIYKFLKHGPWLINGSMKSIIKLKPKLRVLNWVNK